MTKTDREQMLERRVIHPATYRVRHDNGESFEVKGLMLARIRKLVAAECQARGWLLEDIDWWEVEK